MDRDTSLKLSEDPNVPVLEGWVNITEAAEMLGITRQHSYKRANTNGYKSLHRIGKQPAYVVAISEIEEIIEDREERKRLKAEKDAAKETAE